MNFLMSFADFFAKGGPLMWPIQSEFGKANP